MKVEKSFEVTESPQWETYVGAIVSGSGSQNSDTKFTFALCINTTSYMAYQL